MVAAATAAGAVPPKDAVGTAAPTVPPLASNSVLAGPGTFATGSIVT